MKDSGISIHLTPKLRLKQALKKAGVNDPATVKQLAISGTVTKKDFAYIVSQMDETLQELDMSYANIEEDSIGENALCGCSGLTSVVIPNSVWEIEDCAFTGCTGLTSITIPDSVEKMGSLAFDGCSNLTSITIPKSVTNMGFFVLFGCEELKSIVVDVANPVFSSEDGVLFNKEKTELIFCPRGRQGDYVIPDTVVKILYDAFVLCKGLSSITVPKTVKEIEADLVGLVYDGSAIIFVHPGNPVYESVEGRIRRKKR